MSADEDQHPAARQVAPAEGRGDEQHAPTRHVHGWVILAAIALGATGAALYLLFSSTPNPVYLQSALALPQIEIYGPTTPVGVDVVMEYGRDQIYAHNLSGAQHRALSVLSGINLQIILKGISAPSTRSRAYVTVPDDTWGPGNCDPNGAYCLSEGSNSHFWTVQYLFPSWQAKPIPGGSDYVSIRNIFLPHLAYSVSNGTHVSAVLPAVLVYQAASPTSPATLASPTVGIHVVVNRPEIYHWTAGSGSGPQFGGSKGEATWFFSRAPGDAVTANGVNEQSLSHNTLWLFVAGALAGLAGSAVIAVAQAVLASNSSE